MVNSGNAAWITEKKIYDFLLKVDQTFPVPLSEKTELKVFAQKLYQHATLCAVEEDDQIVSMVGGYTENTLHQAAYINLVATLPTLRGKGYGKKLVLEFIERAQAKNLKVLHLYAVRDNLAAMQMYEHLGFVEWHLESEPRKNDVHLAYYLKQKTALVTAIGSFAADIVIKNLKKLDFRVIGTDIYAKEWVADAYNVDEFYQVPKVVEQENFCKVIEEICEKEGVTHLIPSTDIDVDFFNEFRTYFEERNIVVCISPEETLKICRNKKAQQEFIDEKVPSVKTIPTTKVEANLEAPYAYPMICKPYDGRSSQGLRYIYSEDDWKAARTCEQADKYIVQPMIQGEIVTVDIVRSMDGATVVAVPRVELLRTLNGAGLSVKVYPDHDLEQRCRDLANALQVVGCVNFEFLRDADQNYYFVECNPRFSGGVEFSCIAGYNCVENHIRCFERKPIEEFELQQTYFVARKYEEYVTKVK